MWAWRKLLQGQDNVSWTLEEEWISGYMVRGPAPLTDFINYSTETMVTSFCPPLGGGPATEVPQEENTTQLKGTVVIQLEK